MKLSMPLTSYIETFTFEDHLQYAKANNLCYKPGGACPNGYYYPGRDYVGTPPIGAPIFASESGIVSKSEEQQGGYGQRISIKHMDGSETIYAHLSRRLVSAGDMVKRGQQIGEEGWSGNVRPKSPQGAHLHWEYRNEYGVPVDPYLYLGDEEPPTDGEDGEEEEMTFEVPDLPKLIRAEIVVDSNSYLRIRTGPGVAYPKSGQLSNGTKVDILEESVSGEDTWLRIGHEQWIAGFYQGQQYVKFLE